jgi:hypothetical protein
MVRVSLPGAVRPRGKAAGFTRQVSVAQGRRRRRLAYVAWVDHVCRERPERWSRVERRAGTVTPYRPA